MSPEKASILVAEDDKNAMESIVGLLRDCEGHEIVARILTMDNAEETINKVDKLDVALLDGNLTENDHSGYDGNKLAKMIKAKFPEAKIVQYSSSYINLADFKLIKLDRIEPMLNFIKNC